MRNILLASAAAATVVAGFGAGIGATGSASAQAGSFQGSCRNVKSGNGMLTAECADSGGHFRFSSLPYTRCKGDIGNNNGMLNCNGAAASGGQIVDNGNNNRRKDNGGADFAAGAVAGALVGGALASGQPGYGPPPPGPGYGPPPPAYGAPPPPPPGPPPIWGDPNYGNPQFDWRYAYGGWGYGHRPGEWVSIHDRAAWLGRRIEHATYAGRISRGEREDLFRRLTQIQDMEQGFVQSGVYGPREHALLDQRFDEIANRFRYEADS